MIDLHTHILPHLDDGAQSLEDSLDMAKVAWEDGVRTIVATPHGAELARAWTLAEAEAMVDELQRGLERLQIPIKVLPGLENFIEPQLAHRLEDGHALTLNGSRYCLLELPLQQYPLYTEEALFQLQLRGFVPVLAHPERNSAIQRDHTLLERLVERGMLAQVTVASLLGHYGASAKKSAEAFIERNLVHIIASDAHSSHGPRAPLLSPGVAAAARIVGKERAMSMVTSTPDALLCGKEVRVEPPLKAKKSWAFWKR